MTEVPKHTDIARISEIVFEIESEGSFERVDKIVQKVLELAGIHPAHDGGTTYMSPLEDGSSILKVVVTNLEMNIQEAIDPSRN